MFYDATNVFLDGNLAPFSHGNYTPNADAKNSNGGTYSWKDRTVLRNRITTEQTALAQQADKPTRGNENPDQ